MIKLTEKQRRFIVEFTNSPPVKIVGLSKSLGLKVFRANSWHVNQSGLIRKSKDGKSYQIVVNAKHPRERKRFTIAHELAHWILHRDMIGDGISEDILYRSGLPLRIEIQANRLAAEILMPQKLVDVHWKDPSLDVTSMAAIFEVSEQAMAIKLGVPN